MMNFHNNTALTKVLHTLQDTQNSSKESKQVYQSVLVKHFQIIQTFLQKINELYNKHEQFQNSLTAITQKVEKLETNSKNIHYQFRTTHLMIDKRLNTIGADFNNMQEQLRNLRLEEPIDSYLGSSNFIAQSSRLKPRKRKSRRKDHSKQDAYKIAIYSHHELNDAKEHSEENLQQMSKHSIFKLRGSCKSINRSQLKAVQFDGISSNSSENGDDLRQNQGIIKIKQSFPPETYSQSQSNYTGVDEQWVKQEIEKSATRVSDQFNAKIKQLQLLIAKNREQIESKMVTRDQFTLFQYQLSEKMTEKIDQIRKNIQTEQILLREQVLALNKQSNVTFQTFETKLIQKLDSAYFKQSFTNLNAALSQQFTKIQRFYANKFQTKKALDFLQNKINRFIVDDSTFKSKKIVPSNEDACLKINKCQSHKKIEFSQKSIKDKVQKIQQGGQSNYKSLDTSMWQIQAEKSTNILNEQKSNLNSLLSNVSKLKSPSISGLMLGTHAQKDVSKFAKSLSAPKKQPRLSLKISNAQPKVNIKQWREKVVKILRKEDIRKRKVTFR